MSKATRSKQKALEKQFMAIASIKSLHDSHMVCTYDTLIDIVNRLQELEKARIINGEIYE